MQSPQTQQDTCAICLNNMNPGGRQALFTAECSHTFHFECISSNVAHGNLVCPLCMAQWQEVPFRAPLYNPIQAPFFPAHEPRVFNDDDPVDVLPQSVLGDTPQHSPISGTMEVKTFTEYPAVAKSSSKDDFAIVIRLKAPGMTSDMPQSTRAPLDLVTVLDVSGSMRGEKLSLLKQAMTFVIQNLGPADRLSIVSFSSTARRLIRLTRMSNEGVQQALNAVNSLTASGGTNIAEGLKRGTKVLEECQYKNPVISIILLSDGQDTYSVASHNNLLGSNYDCLLPPSILHPVGRAIPIHTFGFGSDHDSLAMHRIAEASGGSFSFIEDTSYIQDAFAQCIGGLLSVVAQDTHITLASADHGVKISGIKSGSYESCVENGGMIGSISVGDLYADEQRSFLLFVNVPTSGIEGTATLIRVNATYRDATTSSIVELSEHEVSIERPEIVIDSQICIDVERERMRVQVMEDMVTARVAAERGEMREAVEILENRQEVMRTSWASEEGDMSCQQLESELRELTKRMSSWEDYENSGRAYVLAGLSAHNQQRATSRSSTIEAFLFENLGDGGSGSSVNYQTPAMARMVTKSQSLMKSEQSLLPDNLP